ncbi:MAG TPA: 4'-phosphopantetheinyl transferase superfamily protein [Streptosporangiaceae bacterium]
MRSALLSAGPPYPRVGVDIVDLGRIARARRNGLDQHICSVPERAELAAYDDSGRGGESRGEAGSLRRLAATWAVKEAAIKAAGGRPENFSWTAIRVFHASRAAGHLARLAGAALHEAVGTPPDGRCHYLWPGSPAGPYGAAAWCAPDDLLMAITIAAPNREGGTPR